MVDKLIDKMEDVFGLSRTYVFGKCRKREIIEIRMQMYALMRNDFDYTLPKIGKIFDRDHSSVIHLLNQHENALQTDEKYAIRYSEFKGKMCGHMFEEENEFVVKVLESIEDATSVKQRITILKHALETYKLN